MPRIKVTAYLDIEDYEYDDGPLGPLTQEAYDSVSGGLFMQGFEEIEFVLAEDDELWPSTP